MGCLCRPCLPRFLERCLRAESMPSGRIRSNAAIWAGNSGADEVGHSDRKEGIEGGLKERRRAAPSGGIAHQAGFRVEFSLDSHQEPITEKIARRHQILGEFSTWLDRLSKPEKGTISLSGTLH